MYVCMYVCIYFRSGGTGQADLEAATPIVIEYLQDEGNFTKLFLI